MNTQISVHWCSFHSFGLQLTPRTKDECEHTWNMTNTSPCVCLVLICCHSWRYLPSCGRYDWIDCKPWIPAATSWHWNLLFDIVLVSVFILLSPWWCCLWYAGLLDYRTYIITSACHSKCHDYTLKEVAAQTCTLGTGETSVCCVAMDDGRLWRKALSAALRS